MLHLIKSLCAFTFLLSVLSAEQIYAKPFYPNTSQVDAPKPQDFLNLTSELPNFTYEELYDLQVKFFDAFIYPADVDQAKSINSTFLAEDVLGRIDITRTFVGRELNTEYLFGLFANLAATPTSLSLLGVPISYNITHFTANRYITSAVVNLELNFTSLGEAGLIVPVGLQVWNTYNAAGEITQYDASFLRWDWMFDYVLGEAGSMLNLTTQTDTIAALTPPIAYSLCTTEQTHCLSDDSQYDSFDSCYQFMTQGIRWGSSYELGRNTLLCRTVHQNMIPYRPSVHCPHVGPSGGGMCDDSPSYVDTVMENFFTIPFIPQN